MSALKIFLLETLPERAFEFRLIIGSRFNNLLALLRVRVRAAGMLIGPANSANQASAWARSLNSQSLRISADPSREWFTSDFEVTTQQRNDLDFRIKLLHEVFLPKKIILLESLRPIFAFRKGRQGFAPRHSVDDAVLLQRMGKRIGVIFHGSDIRDPLAHAKRNPYSPFRQIDDQSHSLDSNSHLPSDSPSHSQIKLRPEAEELFKSSQVNRELLPRLRKRKIPLFITTPDLYLEVPDARWIPAVIEFGRFEEVAKSHPIFSGDKLRVLYLPSRSWIKSSEVIHPILEKLSAEGVIEYRNWLENGPVTHDQIPAIIASADVVIDQLIGLFGVFALEAIAAGRVVMTYIDPEHEGHPTPPHININPDTLESEIRRVAKDREASSIRAQKLTIVDGTPKLEFHEVPVAKALTMGAEFVRHYHDGDYSSKVFQTVFGLKNLNSQSANGIKSRRLK